MADDTNVRVVIRIRPLSPKERLSGSRAVLAAHSSGTVLCPPDKSFAFDLVLDSTARQTDVFANSIEPYLPAYLDGYNCSVLAYGQTGSGKTFTMGTGLDSGGSAVAVGIIPRTIGRIVDELERRLSGGTLETADLYVSFLEIYNEELVDLLDPKAGKRISIREDAAGDILLTGIREERIPLGQGGGAARGVLDCLQKGSLGRTTKSTEMNLVSSRSHAIFTVTLRQTCIGQQGGHARQLVSKLHFVDLAGSERLKRTGAQGVRARESISINSGLLALGNVISALGDVGKKATHVPYRDSKLTRLLQDSLGGNSRTVMLACVSPSEDDLSETVNTLKYAHRAKNIRNRVQVNVDEKGATVFEVMQLKKQIAALKSELLQRRSLADSGEEAKRLSLEVGDLRKQLQAANKRVVEVESLRFGSSDALREAYARIEALQARLQDVGPKVDISDRKASIRQSIRSIDAVADQVAAMQLSLEEGGEEDSLPSSLHAQFASAVRARCEQVLGHLRTDLQSQEQLVQQVEVMQNEYAVMRQRYEERIGLLNHSLQSANRERDEAVGKIQAVPTEDTLGRVTRQKYEEKIKRLGKEVNDSRKLASDLQGKSAAKTSTYERAIASLRNTTGALKTERAQLVQKVELLEARFKQGDASREGELREARLRERKASDSAKRWKRAYDFQRSLLARRSEQCILARGKVHTLLTVLRKSKQQTGGGASPFAALNLNSPSWRKLLASDADIPGRFGIGATSEQSSSPTRTTSRLAAASTNAADGSDDVEMEDTDALLSDDRLATVSEEGPEEDVPMRVFSLSNPALLQCSPKKDSQAPPRSALRESPLLKRRQHDFLGKLNARRDAS